MIVLKVEMWPGGDETRAIEFGRAYIANQVKTTVTSAGALGDYSVELRGGVYNRLDLLNRTWKRGSVTGFDRVRRGAWDLIYQALRATVGVRS
jgi:hypothetical protein